MKIKLWRLFFPVLSLLLVSFSFLPARAGDAIVLDAADPLTVEAPLEVVGVAEAPLAFRDTLAKGLAGETFLQVAQGKGNPPKVTTGLATYAFTIENPGVYYLWCRVWWMDECGNSFFMHIDDANPFVFGEGSTFKTWHWVRAPLRLKQLTLGPGPHTLTLRNREDGVALNQILLTPDKAYVPVGVEPITPAPSPSPRHE